MTRKIRSGSRKDTGFFPSQKNGRSVAFESLLERDVFYLLEYDKDVISYKEQPLTITYYGSKSPCKYTPDILVHRKNRIQLIEVKPYKELEKILADETLKLKYETAARYCQLNGYHEFKFITDEIRMGNQLRNIKYLFGFSNLQIPASARLKIRNQLMLTGHQEISQLVSEIFQDKIESNRYHAYILALLYHQEINSDLQNLINKNSIVGL